MWRTGGQSGLTFSFFLFFCWQTPKAISLLHWTLLHWSWGWTEQVEGDKVKTDGSVYQLSLLTVLFLYVYYGNYSILNVIPPICSTLKTLQKCKFWFQAPFSPSISRGMFPNRRYRSVIQDCFHNQSMPIDPLATFLSHKAFLKIEMSFLTDLISS